ncbi:MAG: TldD/PmbA family protein [Proteobacteria bacterium]|nr:TldD/PmbA family protein [Pseudomonadota bacterium]
MTDDLPFDKIILAAMRHGAEFAEVFVERVRTSSICCDDRRIEQASVSSDAGVGIRVCMGGRTAYGSTNDLTRKSLMALARDVGKMANARRVKAPSPSFAEADGSQLATVRRHPFGISMDDKCSVVSRANEIAWQGGNNIRQTKISYRDRVRRIQIAASDGTFAEDEQVGIVLSAQVVAGDGKSLQTGQEVIGGAIGFELFDETMPEEVADRAARRAMLMLSAGPAPAGAMPVVISSEAGGTMIHEAVGHGLEADLAGEGLSVYSRRIGDRVASPLITVVDDATLPGRRGSFSFDDEGKPAQRTVLIEAGVLKSYMSDARSAKKFDLPRTGNGRRQSYEHVPICRMTNTIILPGLHDPSHIASSTPAGLYVKKMGGGQVNTVNGDFVFNVQEGYIIRGGEIAEPVRGATLIGNGPRVLESIDMVGTDLGFSIGTCGKDGQDAPVSSGQPTLRIPEIVVGGTDSRN